MTETLSSELDWKNEYTALMRQLGVANETDQIKRKTPRFNFNPPERIMLVHLGSLIGILSDISVGGMGFHLEVPLTAEREISVSVDQKFRGRVKVVNTVYDEAEGSHTKGMYRNGTRFLRESDGYRCMVRTLQLSSRLPRFS